MQTTLKKPTDKTKPKEKVKQDIPSTRKKSDKEEEILKKSSTPRNYLQKSSTLDIYGQKKKTAPQTTKAPKKVAGVTHASNVTPSKDFLKSSPSSISQLSARSAYDKTSKVSAQKKLDLKADSKTSLNSARKVRTARDLPFSNVTVSSPVAKRKLNPVVETASKKGENTSTTTKSSESKASVQKKTETKTVSSKALDRGDSKDIIDRQRTKTRTLDENEVKVLTPDSVDNNTEMKNLSKRLSAKPKAFYVELEEGNTKITELTSDNDVSYEDDFESYESDFDSYHSDKTAESSNDLSQNDDQNPSSDHDDQNDSQSSNEKSCDGYTEDSGIKEGKDEEKMLDSGNFELRDRSAKSRPAAMEFILEDAEDDKKVSLTDEGFQDMSSSSAVSNVKSHVDVLDRPLFIDFTKSKECKRKRKLNERLKQRASDLLSMITLHEMPYNLFEMKPIPYDLYMATFGRSNYTQIAVQTFDDGITEEVQTEEILVEHKWTQHPIEFSKSDVYLYPEDINKKLGKDNEDYLAKFTFLVNKNTDVVNDKNNVDKLYKENPLRIYFEQKDGAGSCEMLPYEKYKKKIENNDFNATKLSKFLKKVEKRIRNVLSLNSDKNLVQFKNSLNQKIPLSKGYLTIAPKSVNNEELSFIKNSKITNVIFSETKSNLLMLVHRKASNNVGDRCVICLWDISVAMQAPIKILVAIDNVTIGRFKGSSDGILVAALNDGTLHLWDLSEEPTWRNDVASDKKTTDLVEINTDGMTATEKEREWNAKNLGNMGTQPTLCHALQACAYTNSAANITNSDVVDHVVGLEFVGDTPSTGVEGGRKTVGRVCSLQRVGILTIWSIIQEKTKTNDIGKAYWSKMKLEKTQTMTLLDHIDLPTKIPKNEDVTMNFNLNAAKRRLSKRKSEKHVFKKDTSRPKSTSSSEFEISRPASAASFKRVMSVEKKMHESWENGIVCSDLKILWLDKIEKYLVAKNCGEVLCCTRIAGSFKVERLCIANDMSRITCLGVSPHSLPYFLAATDSGTVNLCSLVEARVLLTLDCRNGPPSDVQERCQSDHKGRFVSSAKVRSPVKFNAKFDDSKLSVTFLHWCPANPCSMYTLLSTNSLSMWDLTCSDIYAKSVATQPVVRCAAGDGVLAILTPEMEVQIHRMTTEQKNAHHLDLFQKYVTLL